MGDFPHVATLWIALCLTCKNHAVSMDQVQVFQWIQGHTEQSGHLITVTTSTIHMDFVTTDGNVALAVKMGESRG